jgi:hypothetical protein
MGGLGCYSMTTPPNACANLVTHRIWVGLLARHNAFGEPGQFMTILFNWKHFINDNDPIIFAGAVYQKECAMPLLPIRERYRLEFEETGVEEVRKRALQSLYSDEKLRHAKDWLDDKDNGIAARSAENVDMTLAIVALLAGASVMFAVFNSLGWEPF